MGMGYKSIAAALVGLAIFAATPLVANVTQKGDTGFTVTWTPRSYEIGETSENDRHFREIRGLGAGNLAEAGRPVLPVEGSWIGVPDGMIAVARVKDVQYEELPGLPVKPAARDTAVGRENLAIMVPVYDEVFYRSAAWYPAELVTTGEPERLRHQRMVPLRVAPFQIQPASGLLRRYRSIEIEITFVPDGSDRLKSPRTRIPARPDGRWEGIYQGAVLNYDQAARFRTRISPPAPPAHKTARTETEYKISIEKSGIYRIPFSELAKDGFPSGISNGSIALYRRGFSRDLLDAGASPFTERQMPVELMDENGNGFFDGDDWILAWLPGFRDDRMIKDYDDRFAYKNVFFLSTEGTALESAHRVADLGVSGATPLQSYPDSIRWEIDTIYEWNVPTDTTDSYFAMNELGNNRVTEVDLPHPDPSVPFAVKAKVLTHLRTNNRQTFHRFVLRSEAEGDTVLNLLVLNEKAHLFREERNRDASTLSEGTNQFRFFGSRGNDASTTIAGAYGYLDWYEIHANFLYRAHDGALDFSNGPAMGDVEMEIDGFDEDEIYLFDVTDRYDSRALVVNPLSDGSGRFRVTLQDSVSSRRRYAAASVSALLLVDENDIEPDDPTRLAETEGDYLVVTWDDFYESLQPFVDYRNSTGYTVQRARISDVYDEFHGGIKDPLAIQNYLRYGFERWGMTPGWVLLVGDGFEDYKDKATNRGGAFNNRDDFDYVPSFPDYQRVIYGSGDHWDASDPWFGLLDGDHDHLAELLIGRFPADTPEDVAAMTAKTMAYEEYGSDDAWRGRVMFISDDAWTFESGCIRNRLQTQFETKTREYAEDLKLSAAQGIDTVNVFLSSWTDPVHAGCPCSSALTDSNQADVDCTIRDSRATVTEKIFQELNEGVLLVNFQGHGNRMVLTHEIILRNGVDYRNRISFDLDEKTENAGRPYIFMAYGCSISEFDRWQSQSFEAVTEEMMKSTNGGSVATFGSTGIEFLQPNLQLNDSILKYFFKTPGVIPGVAPENPPPWFAGVPRWSLGEALALGLSDFVLFQSRGSAEVIRRYALFGDPALQLDALEPTFDVTVDGVDVENGSTLIGHVDGSPVQIVARIHDETRLDPDSIRVFDRIGLVDTSGYALELDSALSTDQRAWVLTYETSVQEGEYDVVFRAVDSNQRVTEFVLSVRINVDVTFDGETVPPGGYVSPNPEIRIEITTPLAVADSSLLVSIDDIPIDHDSLFQVNGNLWVVSLTPSLGSGNHVLKVSVLGQTKTYSFDVDTGFRILDLLNYPNPFRGRTGFYYDLTDNADNVQVEIFTVTGKRIRTIRGLSARAGYNENPDMWDGRDADGDQIANGVYIYRLRARRGGDSAEQLGKAVIRSLRVGEEDL